MAQLAKFKPVLLAVAGILVLWLAFTFGGSLNLSANVANKAEEIEARTAEIERTILAELDRLRRVELDGRLFESDEFKGLKDWSVPLGEPDLGRSDPFAPLDTSE
jgi:hypothetical protein